MENVACSVGCKAGIHDGNEDETDEGVRQGDCEVDSSKEAAVVVPGLLVLEIKEAKEVEGSACRRNES